MLQCWTDMKQSFKKKLSGIKENRRATGGGPIKDFLSDEDLQLMNIIGIENASGISMATESFVPYVEVCIYLSMSNLLFI